jgi:hypothetical protein
MRVAIRVGARACAAECRATGSCLALPSSAAWLMLSHARVERARAGGSARAEHAWSARGGGVLARLACLHPQAVHPAFWAAGQGTPGGHRRSAGLLSRCHTR